MGREFASEADRRFAQFAVIWAIRNRARGAAGRVNVEREFAAALSPVAMRLALGALEEIIRLLAQESGRPIHVHPVPCRAISTDEHRMIVLCRAVLCGDGTLARRIASELTAPEQSDRLAGHVHTLLLALLDRDAVPCARRDRQRGAPLQLH